jgi:hypothetical protein
MKNTIYIIFKLFPICCLIKVIANPLLTGANCIFAPAHLNIFSANPQEQWFL